MNIVLGTRGSDLALCQAHFIAQKLEELGHQVQIKIIQTQGDVEQELSLNKLEGKGFFTKEIEEKLLQKEIDLAVHSHKDLETTPIPGLCIAAIPAREAPEDVLILRKDAIDMHQKYTLKKNAQVGTSSNRRASQFLSIRKDVSIVNMRGNVPTRIEKLRKGHCDALILAYAGIHRLQNQLDLSDLQVIKIDYHELVPAPAQGALALQIRSEDEALKNILAALHHPVDAACVEIERSLLANLEGGCSLPFGAYCQKEHQTYKLWLSYAGKQHQKMYPKPLRFFLQDKEPEVLIQRALEFLKTQAIPFIPSVFISRERSEIELLQDYLGAFNVEIVAKKLIETIPVPFSIVQDSDWIFFNSKTAVRYFFAKQVPLKENIRFAVLGEATQRALQEQGYSAHFIGQQADIKKVAKDFRKLIETEEKMPIVLFPQSSISLRTVQEELSFAAKTIDLIVYRTKNHIYEEPIIDADYYIFTSPSNVESFFSQKGNIDKKKQKMLAIGKTTYEAIKDKGIIHVLLSEKNSELGILNAVLTDIYHSNENQQI